MDVNKILSSDVLDILFEGRNKDYGAYQLRKTYVKRLVSSLVLTFAFTAVIYGGVRLSSLFALSNDKKYKVSDVDLIRVEEKKTEPVKIPPPVKAPELPKLEMKKFVIPKIVEDDKVRPDEKPPTQDDLDKARIGDKDKKGLEDDGTILDRPKDDGTGKVPDIVPTKRPEEEIYTSVEIEASYPGGMSAWKKFLERYLDPSVPVTNGAPDGDHTVMIQFVVDAEGNVSQMIPLTSVGFGMEEEAMRVMKKAAKWIPAKQNGNFVKAWHKQSFTFQIREGG
jgi:periplasmic protein TonB